MATLNRNTSRKSYFLSVTPVNYSLTAGTNIPPPPPDSPGYTPEPPTPGGGPLTSHPATPPASEKENVEQMYSPHEPEPESEPSRGRSDSFRSPTSPISATQLSSSPQQKRQPSRVRKLLSISNLRSSFSSSRTSLSLPRGSNETPHSNGTKRPSSPSMALTTPASSTMPRPQLREKKSGGNWFKRKSSLLFLSSDDGLDPVDENNRPDTRESKRLKGTPPPLLPEIGSLGGGRISNGDLGWDEQAFKR